MSATVNLCERDPITRQMALAQIGEDNDAVLTDPASIVPTEREIISRLPQAREQRGQQLAHQFVKFVGEMVPLLIQVRQDFLEKPADETICGVRTFDEYCTGILRYSRRRIQQLIAGQNPASQKHDGSAQRKPKTALVNEHGVIDNSWIHFDPNFLIADKAQELFDWANSLPMKPESGHSKMPPTHDAIQFGPRQAYVKDVPLEWRIESSGPIPADLMDQNRQMEARYRQAFNSAQFNRHWNEHSSVFAHSDTVHGALAMLSFGAPRRFILRYKHDDKNGQWRAGDIYFDQVLPSGSLLTIKEGHQFDLTHEMPESNEPCGVRISLIWRYITEADTKGVGRHALQDGAPVFRDAKRAWKEAHLTPTKPDPQPSANVAPEPAPQPVREPKPTNPELVARIQAHENVARELQILLKANGIDAAVSRSKTDGKFHVVWHDVTPEQVHTFAETFKSPVLENVNE